MKEKTILFGLIGFIIIAFVVMFFVAPSMAIFDPANGSTLAKLNNQVQVGVCQNLDEWSDSESVDNACNGLKQSTEENYTEVTTTQTTSGEDTSLDQIYATSSENSNLYNFETPIAPIGDVFVYYNEEILIPPQTEVTIPWLMEYADLSVYSFEQGDVTVNNNYVNLDTSTLDTSVEGAYTITLSVKNENNWDEYVIPVTVTSDAVLTDNNPPVISTDTDKLQMTKEDYQRYNNDDLVFLLEEQYGLSVVDDVDGDITISENVSAVTNDLGTFNSNPPLITITATDSAGNMAQEIYEVEFVEEVVGNEPSISGPDTIVLYDQEPFVIQNLSEYGITAFDVEDGDITEKIEIISTSTNETLTETTYILQVSDSTMLKSQPFELTVINASVVSTCQELQDIEKNLAGAYILENDIDCSGFTFEPIGTEIDPFTGVIEGNGYEVQNLTISATNASLVEYNKGIIQNIGITNANYSSETNVGGIAVTNSGVIKNSYVQGNMVATSNYSVVGGIAANNSGEISNCYTDVSISASYLVGGIAADTSFGSILNCYTKVDATADDTEFDDTNFGGIAAIAYQSTIDAVYANVYVAGNYYSAGAIVNEATSSEITNTYATGAMSVINDATTVATISEDNVIENNFYDPNISIDAANVKLEGTELIVDGVEDLETLFPNELTRSNWVYDEGLKLTYITPNGQGSDVIIRGQKNDLYTYVEAPMEKVKPFILGEEEIFVDINTSVDITDSEVMNLTAWDCDGNEITGGIYLVSSGGYDKDVPGDYTLSYQVKDKYGLESEPYLVTLHNIDNSAPEITGPTTLVIEQHEEIDLTNFEKLGITAIDNSKDITNTITISDDDNFDSDNLGTYKITYIVIDEAGNVSKPYVLEIEVIKESHEIATCEDLQSIGQVDDLDQTSHPDEVWEYDDNYELVDNIDCGATYNETSGEWENTFVPIEKLENAVFNGNNYTISNLVIVEKDAASLFTTIENVTITDVKFENVYIEGGSDVALLASYAKGENTIENVLVTGTITGVENVGGLVANIDNGNTKINNNIILLNVIAQKNAGLLYANAYAITESSSNIINGNLVVDTPQKTALFANVKNLDEEENIQYEKQLNDDSFVVLDKTNNEYIEFEEYINGEVLNQPVDIADAQKEAQAMYLENEENATNIEEPANSEENIEPSEDSSTTEENVGDVPLEENVTDEADVEVTTEEQIVE